MYFIGMLAGDLILINIKRKRICNKPNWSRKPVGASSMLNLDLHICCQFFFATSVFLFLFFCLFFNKSNRPSTLESIGILQEGEIVTVLKSTYSKIQHFTSTDSLGMAVFTIMLINCS